DDPADVADRVRRRPPRARGRGGRHERAHDAAPRRRRGAGRAPGGLPALPDAGRQHLPPARAPERRRRPARERPGRVRSREPPRVPPAPAHRAARRARHPTRRRAPHDGLRPPMMRALLLALAIACPAVAATGDATVAFNFQDVDIPVLAKFVSEVTGRNFIVDERVKGKATIISPTRLTPDEAYLV